MLGTNGGLTGASRIVNNTVREGLWTLNEQATYKHAEIWNAENNQYPGAGICPLQPLFLFSD